MIATRLVRTLDVSAASGLVLRDGLLPCRRRRRERAVRVRPGRRYAPHPAASGRVAGEEAERKAHKADFEILVDLAGEGLLAMGSGSRATRERAVLVDRRERTTVIDTAPLCASLRDTFPDSTSKAACCSATNSCWCNAATAATAAPRWCSSRSDDLQRALVSRQFVLTRAPRIVDLDLGGQDGVPWTCTDLALLDDGDLLASAVLEDTEDAYRDGPCLGSALVRIAPDGVLRWHRRLATSSKIEGLAVDGDVVWLVSDADDRAVPSQLLRAVLP